MITINEYLGTATKIILGLGLCFEMPILVFFLARMGVVSEKWLLAKLKYAILIIFIIAAVITPTPDITTQCVFAVPMILLYLLGHRRRLDVSEAREPYGPPSAADCHRALRS